MKHRQQRIEAALLAARKVAAQSRAEALDRELKGSMKHLTGQAPRAKSVIRHF